MRLPCVLAVEALAAPLLLVILVSLAAPGRAHFVTSLHSNFVVNLDFEADAGKALAAADAAAADGEAAGAKGDADVKVMAFAGGKRKFRCQLPTKENRSSAAASREAGASAKQQGDAAKSRTHFIAAKIATLRGTCWKLRKEYWTYDVCFGRKIVQYRPDSDMRFSLGEHVSESDQLLPDGGVQELYASGTDNRTSEVRYECGTSEQTSRTFTVEEDRPLHYIWKISGPTFCAWRHKDGAEARDVQGKTLLVSSLLEALRGTCVNVTQGWWTYEYCYPTGLTQFHLHGNGRKRDPEHTLGTTNGTGAETRPDRVHMTMVKLKPSISPRERRAPPSNHRTLKQRLTRGTVCDETLRPRQTTMHFQCPSNWQTRPETRVVSINEGSLCEYEVLIHTTLLCGHEKFLPTLPKGKETIQCVAEPVAGVVGR